MLAIAASMMFTSAFANTSVTSGACSGASDWWMEATTIAGNRIEKLRSGALEAREVELEVESGVARETWDVELYRNGRLLGRAVRTTRGADGYFWVEREVRNVQGVDAFVGIAINRVTGEVCEGQIDV